MMGIRAAWLFDGIGPELIKDPVVLIEDGKIVSVGSDPVPDLVDLGDVTLLPAAGREDNVAVGRHHHPRPR